MHQRTQSKLWLRWAMLVGGLLWPGLVMMGQLNQPAGPDNESDAATQPAILGTEPLPPPRVQDASAQAAAPTLTHQTPITSLVQDELLEHSSIDMGMFNSYRRSPVIRLPHPVSRLKIDPLNKLRLAFIEPFSDQLKVVHMKSRRIITVAGPGIGQSFTWTPDGSRLLYRKQVRQNNKVHGRVALYDDSTRSSSTIATMAYFTGIPTLDPRSGEFLVLHAGGIIRKKLHMPEAKLARWEQSRGDHNGMFVATPKFIMHVSPSGRDIHKLIDDGSGIHSYSIAHDGTKIAWATHNNQVYMARDHWSYQARRAQFVGHGLDPTWSDDSERIVFAGARTVGSKVADYDLREMNLHGEGRWLTQTSHLQERWPVILRDGSYLFTITNTTDLFILEPTATMDQNPHLAKSDPYP